MGGQFVRLFKLRSQDIQFGGLIGAGKIDYTIIVTYSNEEQIAQGGKKRLARLVTWK
ncbi:MAG: hypothetical protein QGI49_12190 [SAR202 cluster bacterium]|nr:hypothetical protein [SAR202 cluster bacterium]